MSNTAIKTPRATDLNKWVLARIAAGRVEFPNKISGPSANHMRRCMKAGLLVVAADSVKVGRPATESFLRLTDAGIEACNWQAQYTRNANVPTVAIGAPNAADRNAVVE